VRLGTTLELLKDSTASEAVKVVWHKVFYEWRSSMNGEVKRNISPRTGRRFCFRGFQPLLDPLGIVRGRAAVLDGGKCSSPPGAALSNPFLFMLRRNYGRRFLKRDKRSVVKYSHHGSLGDSRPMAFSGGSRGHSV
jgi:hypothetical protein